MSYAINFPLVLFQGVRQIGLVSLRLSQGVATSMNSGIAALSEMAGDLRREDVAARGTAAQLTLVPTKLPADLLPLVQDAITKHHLSVSDAGSIELDDGMSEVLLSAADRSGSIKFLVRVGGDNRLEFLTEDSDGVPLVQSIVSSTVSLVFEEVLRDQGFSEARQSGSGWVMERAGQSGHREVIHFSERDGVVEADAVTIDRHGNVLDGNDCPNLLPAAQRLGGVSIRPLDRDSPTLSGGSAQRRPQVIEVTIDDDGRQAGR